jgi:hypothetical protein
VKATSKWAAQQANAPESPTSPTSPNHRTKARRSSNIVNDSAWIADEFDLDLDTYANVNSVRSHRTGTINRPIGSLNNAEETFGFGFDMDDFENDNHPSSPTFKLAAVPSRSTRTSLSPGYGFSETFENSGTVLFLERHFAAPLDSSAWMNSAGSCTWGTGTVLVLEHRFAAPTCNWIARLLA